MEENNNTENNYTHKNIYSNEPSSAKYWKELLAILVAAFFGGFLAIYFVADQVFDKHYNNSIHIAPNKFERQIFNDFNKLYERERNAFDRDFAKFENDFHYDFNKKFERDFNLPNNKKSFDKLFGNNNAHKKTQPVLNPFIIPDMTMDSVKIKTEFENNKYKVVVGLKAFQGDESKINYNVSGRKLTVFGSSKVKDKQYQQDISFSQDFILPYNADISKITKTKDGNKLVIEVPLKDNV